MKVDKTFILKAVGLGLSAAGMIIGSISSDKQQAKVVEETVKKQLEKK